MCVIFRSSHPDVFLGKGALKICSKFYRKTPMRTCDFNNVARKRCSEKSVISIKLLSNFIEIALWAWLFSCRFAAYFQDNFS